MVGVNAWAQSSRQDAGQMRERLLIAVEENDITTVRNILSTNASWLAVEDTGVKAAGLAVERGFFPIAHYILGVRNQLLNQQPEANGPTPQERANLSQGNSIAPAPRQLFGETSPNGTPLPDALPPAPAPRLAEPTASNLQVPRPPMPAPANDPFNPNAAAATLLPSSGTFSTPSTRTDVTTVPVLPNAPQPTSPTAGPTPLEQAGETGSENKSGFFGKIWDGVKGLFGGDEPAETVSPLKKLEEPKVGNASAPSRLEQVDPVPVLPNVLPPVAVSNAGAPSRFEQVDPSTLAEKPGFFGKITNSVKGLFGGGENEPEPVPETVQQALTEPTEQTPQPPAAEPEKKQEAMADQPALFEPPRQETSPVKSEEAGTATVKQEEALEPSQAGWSSSPDNSTENNVKAEIPPEPGISPTKTKEDTGFIAQINGLIEREQEKDAAEAEVERKHLAEERVAAEKTATAEAKAAALTPSPPSLPAPAENPFDPNVVPAAQFPGSGASAQPAASGSVDPVPVLPNVLPPVAVSNAGAPSRFEQVDPSTLAEKPGFFGKITNSVKGLFGGGENEPEPVPETVQQALTEPTEQTPQPPAAEPEKKQEAMADQPALFEPPRQETSPVKSEEAGTATVKQEEALEPSQAGWSSSPDNSTENNVKAEIPPEPGKMSELASPPPKILSRPPVDLSIGRSLKLGRAISESLIADQNCFRKGKDKGWFCLEFADWPKSIESELEVSAWLYRRAHTLVRYENGTAVRIFSVIPSDKYSMAVSHLVQQFGPPARVVNGTIFRFGLKPLDNPSTQWERRLIGNKREILEVRRFDNIRGMVPDEAIGFIRLYREGTQPIFTYLSDTDLILHWMRTERTPKVSSQKKR